MWPMCIRCVGPCACCPFCAQPTCICYDGRYTEADYAQLRVDIMELGSEIEAELVAQLERMDLDRSVRR